jgi:hypothetical protein
LKSHSTVQAAGTSCASSHLSLFVVSSAGGEAFIISHGPAKTTFNYHNIHATATLNIVVQNSTLQQLVFLSPSFLSLLPIPLHSLVIYTTGLDYLQGLRVPVFFGTRPLHSSVLMALAPKADSLVHYIRRAGGVLTASGSGRKAAQNHHHYPLSLPLLLFLLLPLTILVAAMSAVVHLWRSTHCCFKFSHSRVHPGSPTPLQLHARIPLPVAPTL